MHVPSITRHGVAIISTCRVINGPVLQKLVNFISRATSVRRFDTNHVKPHCARTKNYQSGPVAASVRDLEGLHGVFLPVCGSREELIEKVLGVSVSQDVKCDFDARTISAHVERGAV